MLYKDAIAPDDIYARAAASVMVSKHAPVPDDVNKAYPGTSRLEVLQRVSDISA